VRSLQRDFHSSFQVWMKSGLVPVCVSRVRVRRSRKYDGLISLPPREHSLARAHKTPPRSNAPPRAHTALKDFDTWPGERWWSVRQIMTSGGQFVYTAFRRYTHSLFFIFRLNGGQEKYEPQHIITLAHIITVVTVMMNERPINVTLTATWICFSKARLSAPKR